MRARLPLPPRPAKQTQNKHHHNMFQAMKGKNKINHMLENGIIRKYSGTDGQGIGQDLETGCPKLENSKFGGVLSLKGNHNKLRL